jgi:hypothetical protein
MHSRYRGNALWPVRLILIPVVVGFDMNWLLGSGAGIRAAC